MARFNAEIDDELHRRFGELAKKRGTTMRGLFLSFVNGLLASDTGRAQRVSVLEVSLDSGVEASVEQDGTRMSVRVGRSS